MPARLSGLILAAALAGVPFVATPAVALADASHEAVAPVDVADLQEYVEGASRLEGRLLAPCCWMGTLDTHGSPMANELRREIRTRLKAGEAPDTIEASLVQRYGHKMLAVPDSSPLGGMATLLFLGFGVAGYAAYAMLKRWTKAGAATARGNAEKQAKADAAAGNSGGEPKRDALDDRLDRELAEIEHQA